MSARGDESVWGHFVERRPRCLAASLSADNVDAIADYYASKGKEYQTAVHRHDDEVKLWISWDLEPIGEDPPIRGSLEVKSGDILVRDLPPHILDVFEFSALWEPDTAVSE